MDTTTTPSRRAALAPLTLALLALLAPVAGAGPRVDESWYVFLLGGQRAGWMRQVERVAPDGSITTLVEVEMKIGRGDTAAEVAMQTGFRETADHEPIEMRSQQRLGATTVRTNYAFEGDTVRVTTRQLGLRTEDVVPRPPGDWLTPGALRAFLAERLDAGDERIEYSMLDPQAGLTPVDVVTTVVGPAEVEALGAVRPATEWRVEQSVTPGIQLSEFVDDEGRIVRATIAFGGVEMEVVLSDEAFARSEFEAPELMVATFVEPRGVIESPRTARRVTLLLEAKDGRLVDVPTAGPQRFDRLDAGRGRVTIDLGDVAPAGPGAGDGAYLAPSTNVNSDDPAIRGLAGRAVVGLEGATAADRARAMEAYVAQYVEDKTLGVGFATASEVAQTRTGDCSEHAVLLAAMLRADGIPSRVASGLVYADQFAGERDIFGYHMWTQALVGEGPDAVWLDLDAALGVMDATHVALAYSSLSNAEVMNSMVSIASALGDLSIEIESSDAAGR